MFEISAKSKNLTFAQYVRYLHAVRVKGGMSFRSGMRHGLRNDIIIGNLIYQKWRKEIN